MNDRAKALGGVSMISANYGNLELAEASHRDWFRFLGGTPGEVIFVENGSPLEGQTKLFEGVKRGWVSKLLSVRPGAFDIGKHQAFIAEVSALAMATRPLVLLYHLDVLVAQRGHDDWLVEAEQLFGDPSVFAIGGSFNAAAKAQDLDEQWYLSKKLSGNFALLPRARYQAAWSLVAGDFLRSGFRDEHPLPVAARRFVMEVGLEKLLASRNWYTRVRRESRDWSVFHTNLNGEPLAKARSRFLSGEGVEPYFNAGDELMQSDNEFKHRYFGQKQASVSPVKQLRVAFGASPLGPLYRRILGRHRAPGEHDAEPPTLRELSSKDAEPLGSVSLVVWADDPGALAAGLHALYGAIGGRPAQVVALVSAQDPQVDSAWQAHVEGATDKLLVSRSLPPASGPSLASMTEHGVFAHAHCPKYVLCRASALRTLAGWLPDALQKLESDKHSPELSLPHGDPLERALAVLVLRRDLAAQIEASSGTAPVLGSPAESYGERVSSLPERRGAA